MLFTASTVKDSLDGIREFVARNLAGGVDHLLVFLDDADQEKAAELSGDPHVTAVATDDEWWQGRRPERLNVRQRINANVAKALVSPFDWAEWIFHIDGDESLLVDRELLAGLPAETEIVRVRPWEAVSRRSWPDGRITHFKRMLGDDELTLLQVLGLVEEPTNGHYFHGHCDGKVGVRPALDRWHTLHSIHGIDEERIKAETIPGRLLHFESWSGEEFVRKWVNILNSGGNVVHRPLREPTAVALRTLIGLDLPEQTLRDYLMRVYERTTEDDFDTLRDLGFLDEIDPLGGGHRPEPLREDRRAQLDALLAAVRPEGKRPFHSGRSAVGMLRRLEAATERIDDPALTDTARTAWRIAPEELARAGAAAQPGARSGTQSGSA